MDHLRQSDLKPSWRKPAGAMLIVTIITGWSLIVVSLSEWIGRWPGWLQALTYLVLGLVWITPMKPLLRWMEGGQPR